MVTELDKYTMLSWVTAQSYFTTSLTVTGTDIKHDLLTEKNTGNSGTLLL